MLHLLPGISSSNSYPPDPFTCIFSKPLPSWFFVFLSVLAVTITGSCVDPQNKIGHLGRSFHMIDAGSRVQIPLGIEIGSKNACSCVSGFAFRNSKYGLTLREGLVCSIIVE